MKITNKAKDKMKSIENMKPGNVFEYNEEFWLVTDGIECKPIPSRICTRLYDGRTISFRLDLEVKPVLAEVIIMNDVD